MPRIPQAIVDEIVAHAQSAPVADGGLLEEVCGIVGAHDGVADRVYRIDNLADEENRRGSPYRYKMHPLQMMNAMDEIADTGGSLFAIYHSHIASEAIPSETDVRMAFFPPGELQLEPAYPGTLYILVSLKYDPPQVRAWSILQGGTKVEEPIEVV